MDEDEVQEEDILPAPRRASAWTVAAIALEAASIALANLSTMCCAHILHKEHLTNVHDQMILELETLTAQED